MGKKSKAAKAEKLSKAERRELEAREAELAAELARREAKAAKKAKKKGKGKKAKPEPVVAPEPTETPAEAKARKKSAKAKVADAAAKVIAEAGSEGAKIAAKTAAAAAAEAGDDETDEQIKARVLAKRARRAELEALRDAVDPANAEEVAAYNDELASLGGGNFIPMGGVTSTPEGLEAIMDPTPEKVEKAKAAVAAARDAVAAVAEVVETEHGREFVVGPEAEAEASATRGDEKLAALEAEGKLDDFAKPSEAPKLDFEVNGNGQYKIKRPSDGKIVGYTRVTTYISNLEERTMLEKWKLRMLLEGVAVNDTPDESGRIEEPVVAIVRDLIHRRDVAIAKARKADRKGKLTVGELATYVEGAWAEFKKAINKLAEDLLEVGGAHESREKGTDIHALCELYDREGIDAVGDLLTEEKITPADLADVEAYAAAMQRAGIRVVREHIEQVVVNHELKVAGRLDRVVMVKFPDGQRAIRCVGDIKTGQRLDFAAGKIAQQLEMYAGAKGYDLNTYEETELKLSRTKGVVIHLPAGSGECHIYPVDLGMGRRGNKLSGEVRAWRNEGKRAIDLKTDLASLNVVEAVSE